MFASDAVPCAGSHIRAAGWLAAARDRSERLLEAVAERTRDVAPAFVCVAAAGSLGRLEAGPRADIDTLFVVETDGAAGGAAAPEAVESFFQRITALPLVPPKPQGIFRRPVARHALLDEAARGRIDESPQIFGVRIQMLLDARPIHHAAAFADLRRAILTWYAPRPRLPGDAAWSYLASDLVRYAHAYRTWQRFKLDADTADSWSLRQAKLHSCRFMTWLGLYALLLRAREDAAGEGTDWLVAQLDLSPLERVAVVCQEDSPGLAHEIIAVYETMLADVADPAVRNALVHAAGPTTDDADWRPSAPLLRILELAGELRSRVASWLAARRQRTGFPDGLPF